MDYLFVGLGNPGKAYEATRHNLGIRALRSWVDAASHGSAEWKTDEKMQAEVADVTGDGRNIALFPLTYMNESGQAVRAAAKKYNSTAEHILIIHDDLELPLGEVKTKEGGSAGGHKGVKSIHEVLGTQDIPRLRLGIGRPEENVEPSSFVLSKFSQEEEQIVQQTIKKAVQKLDEFLISNSQFSINDQ